jgi:hypothetical protein
VKIRPPYRREQAAMQAEQEAYLDAAATPELFYTQKGYVVDVNLVLVLHSK